MGKTSDRRKSMKKLPLERLDVLRILHRSISLQSLLEGQGVVERDAAARRMTSDSKDKELLISEQLVDEGSPSTAHRGVMTWATSAAFPVSSPLRTPEPVASRMANLIQGGEA